LADEKRRLEKQPLRPGETPRDQALRHSKGLFALAVNDSAWFAANPELMAVQQYIVEK
jgi:hypothetical protein